MEELLSNRIVDAFAESYGIDGLDVVACNLEVTDEKIKINMSKIKEAFRGLGRTEKVKFVSQKIDYANSDAVAKYVSDYLFDVLNDIGDDEYIAAYLKEKGYEVTKQE